MFLGLAIGWTVLGALCARYDLAISRWVVDRGAAWAALGERYGSLPGVYALAVAALLSYLKPIRTSSRRTLTHVVLALVCSVCVAMAVAVSAYRFFEYRFWRNPRNSTFRCMPRNRAEASRHRKWTGRGLAR